MKSCAASFEPSHECTEQVQSTTTLYAFS